MIRARHEKSILRADPQRGRDFEEAVATLAFRCGLSWFTDEQIADIRDHMIRTDWRRNRSALASRTNYRARQKELA